MDGKPQARIDKQIITKMYGSVSPTQLLLAKQIDLYDSQKMQRVDIYSAISKLFYKSLNIFFQSKFLKKVELGGVFEYFVSSSQIFFEGMDKENETIIVALFNIGLNQFRH